MLRRVLLALSIVQIGLGFFEIQGREGFSRATAQRLAFEEPGEIFVEGMARALLSQASLAPLSSHEHWQEVIDERGKQLNQLASSELAQAAPAIAQLLTVASAKAQSIAPLDMLSMWQGYVHGLTKWRAIINGAD